MLFTVFPARPACAYEGEIPPLPASYYGSVVFPNGNPVPAGTIQAYVGGVKRGELSFTGGIYANEFGGVKLAIQGPSEIIGLPVDFVVVINNKSYQALTVEPVVMEPEVFERLDFTVLATPAVQTNTASSIGATSATLHGIITDIRIGACDKTKYAYKAQGTSIWQETPEQNGAYGQNVSFDCALSSLNPNTAYEFKAMAHNSAGWGEGNILNFATPLCIKGDVNNDNLINIQDIVRTVNFILGKAVPGDLEKCAADVKGDEKINVQDVVKIVNIILGKP